MIFFLIAELQIFYREAASRGNLIRCIGIAGNNHCIFDNLFQFRNAGVQLALLVFRLVILSVLRQVAERARFFQLLSDFVGAGSFQKLEFFLVIVQTLLGQFDLLSHLQYPLLS